MKSTSNTLLRVLIAGVLAGAVGAPVLGQSAPEQGFDKPLKSRNMQPGQSASSTVVMRQDDGENSYELRISDGKTSAKVNGKDVPADRIVREGDTIKILGKDGEALTTFQAPTVTQGDGRAPRAARPPRAMRVEPRTQPPEPPQAELPVERPKVMVGILMDQASEEQLKDADLDEGSQAIIIQGVVPGLPAEKAGIREGDIITEIDGKKPATQERLRDVLMGKKPGDTVSFTVHRDSGDKAIRVRLEKYNPEKLPIPSAPGPENKAFDEAMKQFQNNFPREWQGGTVVVPGPEGQQLRLFTPGHGGDRLTELDKRMAELDEKLSKLNDQMARLEELVEKLSKRQD